MSAAALLPVRHDPALVAAAIGLAMFASYVALDLAARVRTRDRQVSMVWWACGSVAMGTGIWGMHFVAMMGLELPVEIGFRSGPTFLSWLAAVGVSGIGLSLAARSRIDRATHAFGAGSMGAGICAMHYVGMAALDVVPGLVWNSGWVLASVAIAVTASAVALWIFFWMRALKPEQARLAQVGAAVVMGLAISGMHFSGMAAVSFPVGTVCLSADELGGNRLGLLVGAASVLLLGVTMLTSVLDARAQGHTARLAASLRDSNHQLQAANDELRRLAFVDAMTGLPNRVLFDDRLAHAVARLDRHEERVHERRTEKLAVMFVDLDGFKPINDLWGHATGDLVLKEVAARLRFAARESDTLARIGGDEFVYLMEGLGATAEADVCAAAQRILHALQRPFETPERELRLSCSVGIVLYPDQGHRDKLVSCADMAMYAAKRSGGSSFAIYDAQMDSGHTEQATLQQDLRVALEQGQLSLHYQPKIDVDSGQCHGAEALLRWHHPVIGAISPAVFVPMAERYGQIVPIGNWVIEEACRQLGAWRSDGLRLRVAINLSAFQLRQGDLVDRIARALDAHGVEPAQLTCEVTESIAMEDTRATQKVLDGLSTLGVNLSIDDFGTGYSSLAYLRQLRAQQLKIDRSFVKDLDTSADARAVVDAVVRLAHALGMRVVAEGVETMAQREVLEALDCDALQGYLFAKPMSAGQLREWMMGRKPAGSIDFTPSTILGLDI